MEQLIQEIHESNLYKKIHESNLYGIIIEKGTGQSLSNALFNDPKTIHFSMSPSEDYMIERYRNISTPLISRENVEQMLDTELLLHKSLLVNFIWVSNFELDITEGNHGWISVMYGRKKVTLHVTLPNTSEKISILGQISVKILYYLIDEKPIDIEYIDGLWSNDANISNINMTNYYQVINSQGVWERLESQFSNKEQPVIIYKGSFNLLNKGQMSRLSTCRKKYPNSPIGLMISFDTFNKGPIKNMEKRISAINNKKYPVILTQKGLFNENIDELNRRLPNQKWIFPIGYRLYDIIKDETDLFSYDNVTFLVFGKDGKPSKEELQSNCELV